MAPFIFNLANRWKWLIRLKPRSLYPQEKRCHWFWLKRLGGKKSRSENFQRKKNVSPCLMKYPQFSVLQINILFSIHNSNCRLYVHQYLLTPWCRVLLEKLTGLQLVKKFPAFHGTRKLITALTSICHLSLSWASPIQSIYPHPTSWRSVLILSTHLCVGLPSGLLPSGFPTKTLYTPLISPICAINKKINRNFEMHINVTSCRNNETVLLFTVQPSHWYE